MTKEQLKEAKIFRNSTLVFSTACFLLTALIAYKAPQDLAEMIIIPAGGIILLFCHLKIKGQIKKYESLTRK